MNAQLNPQPDLFFCSGETRAALGLARRTDPDTSHDAAARVVEFQSSHQHRILAAIEDLGEATVDEIASQCEIAAHAVGKRLPELERAGQIIATGAERPGDSGRLQRVWRRA